MSIYFSDSDEDTTKLLKEDNSPNADIPGQETDSEDEEYQQYILSIITKKQSKCNLEDYNISSKKEQKKPKERKEKKKSYVKLDPYEEKSTKYKWKSSILTKAKNRTFNPRKQPRNKKDKKDKLNDTHRRVTLTDSDFPALN
uniref:Uncharacterized protein n=1 Tax=Megaviridae environmental sample TaxID=1737588 RepID=A0A5J6VKJ2_9VIRU|nr:MAG: hypothetical protein [Megaviridae environmental sample]